MVPVSARRAGVPVCALLSLALVSRAESAKSVDQLAWLAGSWQGTLGASTIEERWTEPAGGLMLAVARVVSPQRSVMFEFLRIEERANGIYYVAQPNGRPGTDFKLTHLAKHEAVFENPTHDNPKLIRYRLEKDGALVATTEGGEGVKKSSQEFRFTRKH
jgi:hypothetical protein